MKDMRHSTDQGMLIVIPIESEKKFGRFDLPKAVWHLIHSKDIDLKDKDIVIVSSKYAAMAEGRYVRIDDVSPTPKAVRLSARYKIDPRFAQLIVAESEEVLGGIPGFALAVSKGILAPNAGIDRSNVPKGYAILYPKNPQKTADQLRAKLLKLMILSGKQKNPRIGVVLSDSRITPTRLGTIGIAIAASGFTPVVDFRGETDLFGNELKVTVRAVADQLASSAQLVMGEASESVPVALVRGWKHGFDESGMSMLIPREQCLYIQGLKNPFE